MTFNMVNFLYEDETLLLSDGCLSSYKTDIVFLYAYHNLDSLSLFASEFC